MKSHASKLLYCYSCLHYLHQKPLTKIYVHLCNGIVRPITHLNQYWHLRLQITFIIFDSHIISIQINEIGNEYRFQIKFGAASNIIKRQDIEH